MFSKVTVPYYIPTSSVWEFCFLHIIANTSYGQFLNFCHSSRYLLFKICISLIANDGQYLFRCLFSIPMSFSVKCLFVSFAHVLTVFFFCYWILRVLYIIQILVICWLCGLQIFFSHSVACLFILSTGSVTGQTF